jgi:hypothetical protein
VPTFLTGLITTDYLRFPPFPYRSRHWSVDLVETEPSGRHHERFFALGGAETRTVGKEVAIVAKNTSAALKAAFLLQATGDVLFGSSFPIPGAGPLEICELGKADAIRRDEHGNELRSTRSMQGIPTHCQLAIRAAAKMRFVYALTKTWLSLQVFSVPMIDLDPSHSETIPKSPHPGNQVAYANAIVLAYAALEELGLEVRASRERPSMVDGKWNPPVRADLEKRLIEAGVNLQEHFPWDVRGPRTILERERPPRVVSRAPWARWDVRDCLVEVVDAIAHISWIRSKVAAHRLDPRFARALSVYDVSNAQHLARRLFLETLRVWREET